MTSETLTKDWEEEIDSESFLEAAESRQSQSNKMEGVVMLKSAEFVENINDLPTPYKAIFDYDEETDFLVFTGEDINTEEDITLVLREGDEYNDLDIIREWTGRDSISSLAGQSVPVAHTGFDDNYFLPSLNFDFIDDVESAKHAYETGAIVFRDGEWVKSEKMEKQEEFLKDVESYASSGFWFALAIGIFMPFEAISGFFLLLSMSLYVAEWYAGKRKKPIKRLMDRYEYTHDS